jgi:ribosome-associated protein
MINRIQFVLYIASTVVFLCSGFSPVLFRRNSFSKSNVDNNFKNLNKYVESDRSTALYNNVRKKPNNRDKKVMNLLDEIDNQRERNDPQCKIEQDPELPMVEAIVRAADKRKATSISVFRVFALTEVTTFMVLIEGNSKPQNQAISLSIQDDIEEQFNNKKPYSREGSAVSGWILLDYASIIVHVMTPQMNNFYKLEKRWKGAEFLDINYLLTPQGLQSGGVYDAAADAENLWNDEGEEGGTGEKEEDDPFWS